MSELNAVVSLIAKHMHTGHHWRKGAKGIAIAKRALTRKDVEDHVERGVSVGLCPIAPGTSTTRAALLDLDSHGGETPWDSMVEVAQRLHAALLKAGLEANPYRSTGGNGIHLLMLWDTAQDAYSVRRTINDAIATCGFAHGTKGVAYKQVEVFPKQDSVPADGYGSMWVLPLSGESVSIDPAAWILESYPHTPLISSPVQLYQRPEPKVSSTISADLEEIRSAVEALPAMPDTPFDYERWRNVVFAIHEGTAGSAEGLALAQWYNDNRQRHERPDWLETQVWNHTRDDREAGITAATLFHLARENGWGGSLTALTEGFEDVGAEPPSDVRTAPTESGYTDLSDIDVNPAPDREWLIPGWIAKGVLHMLFARGGVGKSLLSQQLATAIANGADWLGIQATKGTVLGFYCEEDPDELRRRQRAIYRHYKLPSSVGATGMHLQARLGYNNVLVHFDQSRKAKLSDLYHHIAAEIARIQPSLVVLDNVAQMFGGDENNRGMVTQFTNAVSNWARSSAAAVILLGHTSKADAGFSGSTAWENVARVRMVLTPQEDGTSLLELVKSNISPRAELDVVYSDGVMLKFDRRRDTSKVSEQARIDLAKALMRFTEEKQAATSNPRVDSYIVKMVAARGLSRIPEKVLKSTLAAMIGRGEILADKELPWKRPNRMPCYGLVLSPEFVLPDSDGFEVVDDLL
jgi:hypothetical protein